MKWIVQIPDKYFGTGLHTFNRKWLAVSFASRWMKAIGSAAPRPRIYKGKYVPGADNQQVSW
jgi:hypothetical protein